MEEPRKMRGESRRGEGARKRSERIEGKRENNARKETNLQGNPVVDSETQELSADVEDANVEEDVRVGKVDLASDLHRTERDEEVGDGGVDHVVLCLKVVREGRKRELERVEDVRSEGRRKKRSI